MSTKISQRIAPDLANLPAEVAAAVQLARAMGAEVTWTRRAKHGIVTVSFECVIDIDLQDELRDELTAVGFEVGMNTNVLSWNKIRPMGVYSVLSSAYVSARHAGQSNDDDELP